MPRGPSRAEQRAARRAVRKLNEECAAIQARHAEAQAQQLAAVQAELMRIMLVGLGINNNAGAGDAAFQAPQAQVLPEVERRIATLEGLVATLTERGEEERAQHFQHELDIILRGDVTIATEAAAAPTTTIAHAAEATAEMVVERPLPASAALPATPVDTANRTIDDFASSEDGDEFEEDDDGWEVVSVASSDYVECAGDGGGGEG